MKTALIVVIVLLVLLFLYQAGVFGKARFFDFDLSRLPWVPQKPDWFPLMSVTWYGFFAVIVPILVIVGIAAGLHAIVPNDRQPDWFIRVFEGKNN